MKLCAIALVLLMDVSGSVSNENYKLQMQGIADSFRHPEIQQLITHQPDGIAVTLIEWSIHTRTLVPWIHMNTLEDVNTFADQVAASERRSPGAGTAVANALQQGIDTLSLAPCEPQRKIIDISGDGGDNMGGQPEQVRDQAATQGITINGLPIVTPVEPTVDDYYRRFVVTPNGFVIVADDFGAFAQAIRRKIIWEISQK